MKRSRTRIQGKKVLTDDVKKLKSLRVKPELSPEEAIDHYKEPIWIEYYIPKESRFAYETKYLYIALVDPVPLEGDASYDFVREKIQNQEFIDLVSLAEEEPSLSSALQSSYQNSWGYLERIHQIYTSYVETQNTKDIKTACYLTESLLKQEPTLVSLEHIKDFAISNLNFWIRTMNREQLDFSLEDMTVSLLIKRRNELWEREARAEDPDFDLLSQLFFEQAFPNRGASDLYEEDA